MTLVLFRRVEDRCFVSQKHLYVRGLICISRLHNSNWYLQYKYCNVLVSSLLVMIMSDARITLNSQGSAVQEAVAFGEAFSPARAILNLKPNDKIASGKRNAQIKNKNCLKGLIKTPTCCFHVSFKSFRKRVDVVGWRRAVIPV